MALTAADIAPFYCPVEPAVHPDVDEAERRALEWTGQWGFCLTARERARVAGSRSADFYARIVPHADLEGLWITACWVYWGFAFDDARCDEGPLAADPARFAALAGTVQHALESPGPLDCPDPYAAAVHDLGERFRAAAGPVQNRRFHHAHRAWLAGVQWQIGNRARGRMPGLDEYLAMRLHAAGGEPTLAMIEIANGLRVPDREMDSPAVCALTQLAALIASLDNDRHSLAKEQRRGQTDQNIVNVLIAQDRCSPAEAVHEATALRDAMMVRFLQLRDRVTPRADASLRRYLADLGHAVRGNIEWGLRVPRYVSPDGTAAPPGTGGAGTALAWTDRPLTGRHDPRRLPSVSWWWHDLV
ncbi:terpene synthase family protein [Streptomyces sp. enrichment culture]|uniref:terpene synthase family protein n=1 Tax=Streptomyces sp. enrichment culture TaxID=1795815 RepID=UPI003F576CF9